MMQAKDVPDEIVLAAIRAESMKAEDYWPAEELPRPAFTWDIKKALPQFPPKVVMAKLRSLVRRNVIQGCDCGDCRGDFKIIKGDGE
jgi:hypothetical protein